MNPDDSQALMAQALEALRAQQPREAQAALKRLISLGKADAAAFLGMAYASAMLEDTESAQAWADKALAIEPLHVRALLLKADLYHLAANQASAAAFYQAALTAQSQLGALPVDLRKDLERAQSMAALHQQQLQDKLQGTLKRALAQGSDASSRFVQSLELLLGQRKLYLQQPKHLFFPELPHIQFHPRERFPWLSRLEAATNDIREELLALLDTQSAAFTPYVQRSSDRPTLSKGGMLDNADWSAMYLWRNGKELPEHTRHCPKTLAALAEVPLCQVIGRSPSVLFSLLRPGAHIPAHTGIVNTRLIVHLPLIVPPGCRFRVGNETREWVQGQAWVFDDTIEHEAWNTSDQPRVILLLEIWQPDLSQEEQRWLQTVFGLLDEGPSVLAADGAI